MSQSDRSSFSISGPGSPWVTQGFGWRTTRYSRDALRSIYSVVMPRYEFRCRACGDTFEVARSMADAGAPATCPAGHDDTVRLLSAVALTGRSAGATATQVSAPAPRTGGCCGGACGCG
jgi:putative FmdB family regulatory protein